MEKYVAVAACVFGGVGAFCAVMLAPELCGELQTARRRPLGMRRRALALLEVCGHWVPLVRFGNAAAVKGFSTRLEAAFAQRGIVLSRRGCVACMVLLPAVLALAGLVVSGSLLGCAVGCVAAAALLAAAVGRHESSAKDLAAAQMPEVLRSISAALGAGKSLPQAIEHVGRNLGEPMGSEFLKTSFEIKGGRSIDEAVGALCSRVDAPGVALLGTALQISQRTGSPVGDLFSRTSQMVGETVALKRELQVKTSQVRLSAKVVSAMPVVLTCVLVLLSEDYRAGLALPAGRACLVLAALLDAVALYMVGRIMQRSLM